MAPDSDYSESQFHCKGGAAVAPTSQSGAGALGRRSPLRVSMHVAAQLCIARDARVPPALTVNTHRLRAAYFASTGRAGSPEDHGRSWAAVGLTCSIVNLADLPAQTAPVSETINRFRAISQCETARQLQAAGHTVSDSSSVERMASAPDDAVISFTSSRHL